MAHKPPLTDDPDVDFWTQTITTETNDNASRASVLEAYFTDGELILVSPNGTRYKLVVANDGTLSATAL